MSKQSEMLASLATRSVKKFFGFRGLWIEPVTLTADDSEVVGLNVIPGMATVVEVTGVTNDANDFIVLPALSSVPNGHTITVITNAGANHEIRTPAASGEEINSEDCDGTKEYLMTDTQIHYFVKINSTIGWMAHGKTAIGAAVTPVVPD